MKIVPRLLAPVIVLGLMGAACRPAVTDEPSPVPSVMPTPTPEPASTSTASPETNEGAGVEHIGQLVSQVLRQQLHLVEAQVAVVEVVPTEWPDSCLGVTLEGLACAEVVTPGYRVMLEVEGERYVFHTDQAGSNIVLAAAPTIEIADAAVVWTGERAGRCRTATLGSQTVAFGPCGGAPMRGAYATPDRVGAFSHFVQTYASFEAETAAGKVAFTGQGAVEATAAERRMIAEWARLGEMEAEAGRSGASYGLALAWHREGGIAGFCDNLEVYVTGDAYAASCSGAEPDNLGHRRLTAAQLEQLYAWTDTLKPFEMGHTDDAVADAMTVRVVFSGAGPAEATVADRQAIQGFAARLFAEVTGAQGEDAAFAAWLRETLAARDYDQMQTLMGEAFAIAHWRGEGATYPPEDAVDQLRNSYLGADTRLVFSERDLTGLLGSVDPLSIFGPDVAVARIVYASGWGLEGGDDALLYIAQRPDGGYAWHGVLIGPRGFEQPPSPGEVQETEVEYVLALEDVPMYAGPGDTYELIGQVFGGQIALVTGVSADGAWWRVICPDDTVGSCWLSADQQLTQPAGPGQPGDRGAVNRSVRSSMKGELLRTVLAAPGSSHDCS